MSRPIELIRLVDDEVIGAQHVGQAAPDQHVAGRGACLCADPLACQRRIIEPAEREMVGTAGDERKRRAVIGHGWLGHVHFGRRADHEVAGPRIERAAVEPHRVGKPGVAHRNAQIAGKQRGDAVFKPCTVLIRKGQRRRAGTDAQGGVVDDLDHLRVGLWRSCQPAEPRTQPHRRRCCPQTPMHEASASATSLGLVGVTAGRPRSIVPSERALR